MTQQQSSPRNGPGCFAYGCLIATVIFCVVIGGVWFFGVRSMRGAVQQYTSQTFVPLPATSTGPDVAASALKKFTEAKTAARGSRSFATDFTENELQALLDTTAWRDWVRVGLIDDEADVRFSFPLAALGDWAAASFIVGDIRERFLVGEARCRFMLQGKEPTLSFSRLVLGGQVLEDLPRGHAAEWVLGAVAQVFDSSAPEAVIPQELRMLREVAVRGNRLVVFVGP